ncbi:MAG: nucleotidyltransferase family protein [Ramlibacter sp.]
MILAANSDRRVSVAGAELAVDGDEPGARLGGQAGQEAVVGGGHAGCHGLKIGYGEVANPRVFGSVIHGDDTEQSDLDILVDAIDGKTTLVSLARIQMAIEALTGVKADVLTPLDLHERFRSKVVREAQSV